MKKYIAIFLSLLYIAAMAKPLAPMIDYMVNHEYISKVLCVNKEKPEKGCEGMCYLQMQYVKQDNEEEDNTPVENLINLQEYPIGLADMVDFEFSSIQTTLYLPLIVDRALNGSKFKVYHPPRA